MTTGVKRDLLPRRLAGAVIAAMAAMSGGALAAQPGYVVNSTGNHVIAAGECVRTSSWSAGMAQCPPAQVAQASTSPAPSAHPERWQGSQAAAPATAAAGASATQGTPSTPDGIFEPGYVNSSTGWNVRSSSGECVRAGHWTPAMASPPCDAVARVAAPAPEPTPIVKAPEPVTPAPAPAPVVKPEPTPLVVVPVQPRGPMIQKITLETDVLFGFDKAELRPEGKRKLDEIADGLKDAKVSEIVAIGYTDPIGSEKYNQKLSSERAAAVKQYLTQKGISSEQVMTEGRGETNLVTGGDCRKLKGQKLIQCFEPNRRVEIEVFGTREVAAGEQPAAGATGATGTTGGSSSGSGSR